jgi:hypothetical protein
LNAENVVGSSVVYFFANIGGMHVKSPIIAPMTFCPTLTHPITGTINAVPRKERDDPHRALGWMIKIDGKSTGPFNTLKEKAQQFTLAIYGSRMHHQDVSLAYKCYYIVGIGYTLAATKMSANQCNVM